MSKRKKKRSLTAKNYRQFVFDFFVEFTVFVLGGVFIGYLLTLVFQPKPSKGHLLVSLLCGVSLAWIASMVNTFRRLPQKLAYDSYEEVVKEFPQLKRLILTRFHSNLRRLQNELRNLTSDTGETWTPPKRLRVASCMLDKFSIKRTYWATSTDAPYENIDSLESFFNAQKKFLKGGDVKRLLVFSLPSLLSALADKNHRENLSNFVELHNKHNFELLYWPKSLQVLKRAMERWIAEQPVLVDFGIVGNSLVFGQAAKDTDKKIVSGNGFIHTDSELVALYTDTFTNLWHEYKHEMISRAQLIAINKLCEMRYPENGAIEGESTKEGKAFFDELIDKIKNSKKIWAIDIASEAEDWYKKYEYKRILNATITSAQSHNKNHGRIFVLSKSFTDQCSAMAFIEKVIKPQVKVNVEVFIFYFSQLAEKNLAAVDCIFSDSWGFYLLPQQPFEKDSLSENENMMIPEMIGYFEAMYKCLTKIKRVGVKCVSEDDCGQKLIRYLQHPQFQEESERSVQ